MTSEDITYLLSSPFFDPYKRNCAGDTLLCDALKTGRMNIVSAFMDILTTYDEPSKVLDLQNNDGDTALHIATKLYPRSETVTAILNTGATLGIRNNENEVVEFNETNDVNPLLRDINVYMLDPKKWIEDIKDDVNEEKVISPDYPEYLTIEDGDTAPSPSLVPKE